MSSGPQQPGPNNPQQAQLPPWVLNALMHILNTIDDRLRHDAQQRAKGGGPSYPVPSQPVGGPGSPTQSSGGGQQSGGGRKRKRKLPKPQIPSQPTHRQSKVQAGGTARKPWDEILKGIGEGSQLQGGFQGALGDAGGGKDWKEAGDVLVNVAKASEGDTGAIVKLIKTANDKIQERMQRMLDDAKGAQQEAFGAATSQRAGDVAAHGFKSLGHQAKLATDAAGVGNLPGAFGGKVRDNVEMPFKFSAKLAESIERLRQWNEHLHESNVRFAEFSGPMAAVDIRQQVRDIQLSRTRGSRRAESAEMLASSKHELERVLSPWEDALANVQNKITAYFDSKLVAIITPLNEIASKFGLNLEETPSDELHKWFTEVGNSKYDSFGRPKRLGP